MAISAKDELHSARKELDMAVTGAESASVVKLTLAGEVDHLQRAVEEGGGLQSASLATGTIEFADAQGPNGVRTCPASCMCCLMWGPVANLLSDGTDGAHTLSGCRDVLTSQAPVRLAGHACTLRWACRQWPSRRP